MKELAFFGAFNPPTTAHLELARHALKETGRDKVIFVPSRAAYIRDAQGKDFAYDDEQRLAMLRRAMEKRPWMAVEEWELHQDRQPRTYDTLCQLRAMGYHPALLMGSDKLPELERGWLHVKEIAAEFGIVCLARGEDDCHTLLREDPYLSTLAPHIQVIDTPEATRHVSSTEVRKRVKKLRELEEELKALVPDEILPLL